MSLGKVLDEVLDDAAGKDVEGIRTLTAHDGERSAEVDVHEVGRLGVRVSRIRVEREDPYDVEQVAREWPRTLRDLPDRIEPVEVDANLGGASLRSKPDEMRDDRFIDVEVRGRSAEVRRLTRNRGGERRPADMTLTREQLGRMVDDLVRGGSEDEG